MTNKSIHRGVSITFLGHACFRIVDTKGIAILVDPWIKDNPQSPSPPQDLGKIDMILVTHAHGDHLGDTIALAKASGATVISMPEVSQYLIRKGVNPEKAVGMNKGGTLTMGEIAITMVHAIHSSSIAEGDDLIYGGEAAGFVVRFSNGFGFYHAGDTGVFGDMKIIGELYKPELAMLPIGNHYVMGPEEAAYACRLLKPKYVIPMHFGTFPVLTGTPEKFRELMKTAPEVEVLVMQPGETLR
jgi:L-ascorbate metabolism protein UlaG (beta-lactamase superfamily)